MLQRRERVLSAVQNERRTRDIVQFSGAFVFVGDNGACLSGGADGMEGAGIRAGVRLEVFLEKGWEGSSSRSSSGSGSGSRSGSGTFCETVLALPLIALNTFHECWRCASKGAVLAGRPTVIM